MTYYHPAWTSGYKHHLRHGFLSQASLHKLEGGWGHFHGNNSNECNTLACTSYEAAVEYSQALYGSIEITILEIAGDYETWPIKGTLVPEGTVMLLGEITADCVSLAEPTPVTAPVSGQGPKL
jgi:hypothetical protein|nr:hypothetical protein [Neorhizobium tomejilense]